MGGELDFSLDDLIAMTNQYLGPKSESIPFLTRELKNCVAELQQLCQSETEIDYEKIIRLFLLSVQLAYESHGWTLGRLIEVVADDLASRYPDKYAQAVQLSLNSH